METRKGVLSWRHFLCIIVSTVALVASVVLVGCSSEQQSNSKTDNTTTTSNSNHTQTEFTSNDWKSWQFAVNGKVLTLPFKLSELEDAGLTVTTKEYEGSNGQAAMWIATKGDCTDDSPYMIGVASWEGSNTPLSQIEAKFFYCSLSNKSDNKLFEITMPGNITWGVSTINDAVNSYGQYNDSSEGFENNTTWFDWYVNPAQNWSSGRLRLECNNETGVIEYICLTPPDAYQGRVFNAEEASK